MGSRGNKRRRADGTIANGKKQTAGWRLSGADAPVEVIPAAALREIVPIILNFEDSEHSDVEGNDATFSRALYEIAERFGVDAGDLEYRATRVCWLLESKRPDLAVRQAGGTLLIEEKLLDFASTYDPRERDALLMWANQEVPRAE